MAFLARHPRQVFTRAQLLEHVWGSAKDPGPMASSWLCTTIHRPEISRQTLVFLTRVNSVPEAVAKVTSK